MPQLKDIPEDVLAESLIKFSQNFVSYSSSTEGVWPIVRYLNRLYAQDADLKPSTADTYSSAGEAIWFQQEVNNGLND